MSYERKERRFALAVLAVFLCAVALHYGVSPWGFYRALPGEEAEQRLLLVQTAESHLGLSEADGSHMVILDQYNTLDPLPQNYLLGETDSWCAAFVTVCAMEAGLTDIIPPECGCERQIGLLQDLGYWEENDNAVPQPGDLIYYDWDQKKPGEAIGWSDHVGIVAGVKWPFVKVIEGNKDDSVSVRILPLGHKSIRGYGKPAY